MPVLMGALPAEACMVTLVTRAVGAGICPASFVYRAASPVLHAAVAFSATRVPQPMIL